MPSRASGTSEQSKPVSEKASEPVSQKASEPVSQKASEQSKPEQLKTLTPMVNSETLVVPARPSQNNTSAPTASSAQSAVQTPEEDEWEYVTVTKTRVVRKRPKVAKKTVTSTATVVNKGTKTVVAPVTKKVTTATKTNSTVKTTVKQSKPVPSRASGTSKPVSKKASEPVQSAPSAVQTPDPNAPKVSRQRINNNETITTVERKGGDASQVGNDGKTKITKRKRKDGTEETVYTTTEVVKKRKK